jgi:hypothetical protein
VLLKTLFQKVRAARRKRRESQPPTTRAAPEHVVPPPREETLPDPPRTAPESYATESGLITDYPDRSEWEADVSRRAREEIHAGKRPKRNKGPTTEAG